MEIFGEHHLTPTTIRYNRLRAALVQPGLFPDRIDGNGGDVPQMLAINSAQDCLDTGIVCSQTVHQAD
jgi:hypothetical protein